MQIDITETEFLSIPNYLYTFRFFLFIYQNICHITIEINCKFIVGIEMLYFNN